MPARWACMESSGGQELHTHSACLPASFACPAACLPACLVDCAHVCAHVCPPCRRTDTLSPHPHAQTLCGSALTHPSPAQHPPAPAPAPAPAPTFLVSTHLPSPGAHLRDQQRPLAPPPSTHLHGLLICDAGADVNGDLHNLLGEPLSQVLDAGTALWYRTGSACGVARRYRFGPCAALHMQHMRCRAGRYRSCLPACCCTARLDAIVKQNAAWATVILLWLPGICCCML